MIKLSSLKKKITKIEILDKISYSKDDIVFVSGSLIEGIGNEKSDLDVFIVKNNMDELLDDDTVEYDQGNRKVSFFSINEIGIDVEYWSSSSISDFFNEINSINLNDESIRTLNQVETENIPMEEYTSFIHRLITGKPIFNNDEFRHLVRMINLDNYYRLMMRLSINEIDNIYDDIVGNFEKKEYETSLLLAKNALTKSIVGYLYSCKISIDREKWAYIKLREHSKESEESANLLLSINKLLFDFEDSNKISLNEIVEEHIYLINKIITISENNMEVF